MDCCSCLVDTITPNLKQKLCFDTEENMIESLKSVEAAHWNYIDNYYSIEPEKYKYVKLTQFLEQILEKYFPDIQDQAYQMIKTYTKYKKSVSTDGIIMYTMDGGLNLLLVTVSKSKLWSMPKGKREAGESSLDCAIREFKEETGIDISDSVNNNMKSLAIMKTNFYILEADHKITGVNMYRSCEISGVKWIPVKAILANPENFSKQAYLVATYLIEQEKI
jgi:hypothetical protein